jgi:hypothetical protein
MKFYSQFQHDKFFNFLTLNGYKFITRLGCDELYKKIK